MSKRNLILLIIILSLAVISVFGFLYFRSGTTAPTDEGTGTNFISQFNPFGSNKTTPPTTTPEDNTSEFTPAPAETPVNKLVQVSSMPVAGFTVFSKERLKDLPTPTPIEAGTSGETTASVGTKKPTPPPTEFAPALRYVDRATGNIYQTFADKIEERQFSGTIIPKVYDAYFGNRGQAIVMRYLKPDERTIETFVGVLPKELLGGDTTGDNEIKGSFLPNNVTDISISPDTSKMFYLFTSGDNMFGTTLSFLNNKKIQIFDSPFTEWLSFWGASNTITLTTKPSANVGGYMYSMDGAGKNLTKVLGEVNGLITLGSPNGKLILYSDNNLSLSVYHTDTRNSDVLGFKTLPEKCVWGKGSDSIYCAVPKSISPNEYPDAWYRGEISFSDQLWKIDIKTGNGTIISDPVITGEEIDGIKLALEGDENYLFFVNKKDSLLWKLDLK
ncbi:hypothetical protein A2917_03075 [Candidatus Nomurabacteria bacterium RIFCSPLOWO2_01_FULL_42_17]|uniref:Uncharacterized protein n=1 Tax=Candidatus Nomurabacteria bacterium RIFCSPLOWO2_01_FULL_42_17 TaxID=1801780 RepID=A0A1F6XN34_9BACT|nr:MAG: hypothetical protein A2917_03075 [Candidatus Nomurabacteria bacterium RIFCSPLOWO2_01_FULL_42_17]